MNNLHHFEITAANTAATAKFYSSVFGWAHEEANFEAGYYLLEMPVSSGPTAGVMHRKQGLQPVVLWFDVASIDDTVAAVMGAGGKVFDDRHTIPSVGDMIRVSDPEGTVFGLRQKIKTEGNL